YNKEKIVSMDRGRYMDHASLPNITMSEDDSKTKIIEDGAGHSFLRQRSLDEDLGHLIIPFDYQCVGEGRFLVTYIPRSAGLHYITILSQGGHIQGSPFEVK
ncbi:serine-rich adhesin for platelets, partial [Biomphalaria pfeifferi]